jgi:hypothetical protein
VVTFGLIWLDYLRDRGPDLAIHGLVIYLPAGQEKLTCLRLPFLNPHAAQYAVFIYDDQGYPAQAGLKDYGNLDTRLQPCRRSIPMTPSTRSSKRRTLQPSRYRTVTSACA